MCSLELDSNMQRILNKNIRKMIFDRGTIKSIKSTLIDEFGPTIS